MTLVSELENETFLAEALLFPEVSRFEDNPKKVTDNLRNALPDLLDRMPTAELHGRRAPQDVTVRKVSVVLKPSKRGVCWSQPVSLDFHVVCWTQPGSLHGFVPTLGIEVLGDKEGTFEELISRNILGELQRRGAGSSLSEIIWYQRIYRLTLEAQQISMNVQTPRKKFEEASEAPSTPSVLKDVATLLNPIRPPRAYEMEEELRQLAELLVGLHGRSVLLVGTSGVGKTALIYELVRERRHHHLAATKFWETTGARLMVGADSFGDWQERCRQVVAEASHNRAILILGNLFELAEVARHATTPQGMAGFFRPYIERGDLLTIVECTPQQRTILERDHPHLLQSFGILELKKPDQKKVQSILQQVAGSKRVTLPALQTIERLHRRYASYSAYPGRPLRFLKELMVEVKGKIHPRQVTQAFAEETGMPQFMIEDQLSLDLAKTKSYFAQRIMGQSEAVDLVVDLLASVKAALTPPGRPIASLMFIGPTGVGKTEMARTLAGFLFRDRKRMVRFDMSEFADPISVERLVGGQAGGQGLLTSKVREQPFGIVLFDELEKADPSFFDLLLQILGEGRLTDAGGRLADFTNSLVVMTSNLGAASFSKGPLGFRGNSLGSDYALKQFSSAVKAAFRPELFNRIDRLVPFAPLSRETASSVARRELKSIQGRDGLLRSNLKFEAGDEVATFLAELGYDRRYGARPLRRAIEKNLLEKLATIANTSPQKASMVTVDVKDGALAWSVEAQDIQSKVELKRAQETASEALKTRRRAQSIYDCQLAHNLRNKVHQLGRIAKRQARRGFTTDEQKARLTHLTPNQRLVRDLEEALEKSRVLETEIILAHRGLHDSPGDPKAALLSLLNELDQLVLRLYTSRFEETDKATVVILAQRGAPIKSLVAAYAGFWKEREVVFTSYRLTLGARETKEQEDDPILRLNYGEELEDRALWCEAVKFSGVTSNSVGVAFELRGPLIFPLMLAEMGLHAFGGSNPLHCEVAVLAGDLKDYLPPSDIHTRKKFVGTKRRTYNQAQGIVEDPVLNRRMLWQGKYLERILSNLIPAQLQSVAEEACS